jgi:hypothetical protein
MRKASRPMIGSFAAILVFASLARTKHPIRSWFRAAAAVAKQTMAGPFLAATQSVETSIIIAQPKCGDGTTLTGAFVMETPRRAGFPLDATHVREPRWHFH